MPEEYTFKKYRDGDETEINDLYSEEFGESRDLKTWNWKFKENSAGIAHTWLAVDDKGKIIGNLSLNPAKIHICDQVFLGGQAQDVVVKKEYRVLGKHRIVVELADRATRGSLENEYFDFLFGYPNKLFLRLTIKILGYSKISKVYQMTRPLKLTSFLSDNLGGRVLLIPVRIVDRMLRMSSLRLGRRKKIEVTISKIHLFDERLDQLWQDFANFYQPASVVRDKHYLNWRYARHPGVDYAKFAGVLEGRVVGYIVCRIREEGRRKRGYICDILALPEMEKWIIPELLNKAIEHCDSEGADSVTCWALPHVPLFRYLKRRGFVARPSEINLVAKPLSEKVSKENLFNPDNWYVSMGDSDGI